LLLRFDADLQLAGEKYELMRRQLIKYFECRGCNTARELTDESINRVTRKISEGENIPQHSLSSYFYGVAHNVLREWRIHPEKYAISIDDLDVAPQLRESSGLKQLPPQQEKSMDVMLDCLDRCIEELPNEEQQIILQYYSGEFGTKIDNRKKIAERIGTNINNLRIRVYRIREKLERCVRLCSSQAIAE
jgi:RNA polymerase sigma factor (sigma-70 family)